jgi:cell division protein ZipA
LAEFRWILLGLGLLLIGGIWWWGARRSRRTAPLSESSTLQAVPQTPQASGLHAAPPSGVAHPVPDDEREDWGVPPFEPLHIKSADFDRVPRDLHEPSLSDDEEGAAAEPARPREPGPVIATEFPPAGAHAKPAGSVAPAHAARPRTDESGRFAQVAKQQPNVSELQRIVTIRVCALGESRWSGRQLMTVLELQGLAFGKYQVYHRKHADGRSLFCVASLIEPGTFDMTHMPEQDFRGVSLFAILPGPAEPLQTIDSMIATARALAESLTGMMQDDNGMPMSPQRAAALREDVARFQSLLY